jgi:hypothetical protein
LAAIVCAAYLLGGCGHPNIQGGTAPAPPGERQDASAGSVHAQLRCANRPLPFAHLDTIALIPGRAKPGESVNYRIVYSLCTGGGETVTGRLRTRVLRGTNAVLTDTTSGYRLKPGRWIVDSTITVPPAAPEGTYSVAVDFAGPVSFARALNLVVRR